MVLPKKTSFTSEEEATSALVELRLAEVKGQGEVNLDEKDVPKESGAHMEERSEENVVVEHAPMVQDTASTKKETRDEVVEGGAEGTPSVTIEGELKVQVEDAKPDEEPKEGVLMQYTEWGQHNEWQEYNMWGG